MNFECQHTLDSELNSPIVVRKDAAQRFRASLLACVIMAALVGCRDRSKPDVGYDQSNDTVRQNVVTDTSKSQPGPDTSSVEKPAAPIPNPISPERLSDYLPAMSGFQQGELQKETRVRPNFKSSKVLQTYTSGDKKYTVEINDYCNVPFLYDPFAKFMEGDYLNDDNVERTETTTIKGFKAVQTWEKKNNRGNIFVFPGGRYVISIIGEGVANIGELRAVAESMDLGGLAVLQ
jgi:hypothetical protein